MMFRSIPFLTRNCTVWGPNSLRTLTSLSERTRPIRRSAIFKYLQNHTRCWQDCGTCPIEKVSCTIPEKVSFRQVGLNSWPHISGIRLWAQTLSPKVRSKAQMCPLKRFLMCVGRRNQEFLCLHFHGSQNLNSASFWPLLWSALPKYIFQAV